MSGLVHIVDHDAAARLAIAGLVAAARFNVAHYATVQEFLAAPAARNEAADECLVLDLGAPGKGGLDALGDLRRLSGQIPVIAVCSNADVPTAVRAMRNGARTFLPKPIAGPDLIEALQEVLRPHVEQDSPNRSVVEAFRARLTPRQCEVFDLLRKGKRTKEIAKLLAVSPRTVEVHRAKLMKRLGATNITHLIGRLLEGPSEMR